MTRFVILEHDHPSLHWDLMLEERDMLRSWRLSRAPAPGMPFTAELAPDHRRMYLDYEGPVSGGRGRVARWDHGDYETLICSENAVHLRLEGKRICGILVFHRETATRWHATLEAAGPVADPRP